MKETRRKTETSLKPNLTLETSFGDKMTKIANKTKSFKFSVIIGDKSMCQGRCLSKKKGKPVLKGDPKTPETK